MNDPHLDLPSLREYRHVVIVTGAGISAESGIATYRAAGSGWNDQHLEWRSHTARYGNFLPELWQFWGSLRAATTAAAPNPAHLALAAAEARTLQAGGSFLVATQNIDGLHQRAGSRDVIELHGSIHRTRCVRRACTGPHLDGRLPEQGAPLSCETCGKPARPDVVLFGESLAAADQRRVRQALRSADLCVYVGTSGNVWPVAGFVDEAAAAGARCVLVNADPWDEPNLRFSDTFLGPAGTILPAILGA